MMMTATAGVRARLRTLYMVSRQTFGSIALL
jgi:hypothetical protein